MSGITIFINKKWKNTDLHNSLSRVQFRVLLDESIDQQIDFKVDSINFCYFKNLDLAEARRSLAKLHNKFNQSRLQVFIEINSIQKQDFFNNIQEFAVIELKIQVIPVDNVNDLTQYLERFLPIELSIQVNPFSTSMQINNSHNEFISCLKLIPKIGDKSAQQLIKNFKNIRAISNATIEDLTKSVGANCAKSIYSYFNQKL